MGSNGNGGAGGSSDCVPRSGATTDQYVFDTFTLPQQASDLAFDLTGSGHPVNQYGAIISGLSQQGSQPQLGVDAELQSGQLVMLLSESSVDASRQNDSCAAAALVTGAPVTMPPTAGATYTAGNGSGEFAGPIVSGTFDSADPATTKMPVSMLMPLPIMTISPISVPIVGAHVRFSDVGGRIMAGQINGAVKQTDVDNIIIPAMAESLEKKIAMDQAGGGLTSTDMSLLLSFDTGGRSGPTKLGCSNGCASTCQNPNTGANACGCAVAGDNRIDECEVATNSTIEATYAPDVQMFDASGNYAPNPTSTHKDSLSFGLAFTALPAHF